MGKAKKFKKVDPLPVDPNGLSGLVIAVSGTIPGTTHASIEERVNNSGARFERVDISNCTHLVTTKAHVQNATQKVSDAMRSESCKIVSMEWLLGCIEKMRIIDVQGHSLWEPERGKKSEEGAKPKTKVTVKRKRDGTERPNVVDLVKEDGAVGEAENVDWCNLPFLFSLLDTSFPESKKAIAVYRDKKDVIWDATLMRPYRKITYRVQIRRIQLLCNFKSRDFATWFYKEAKNGKTVKPAVVRWGTLENAIAEFQAFFMDASGLEWKDRHQEPKTGKFLFIACNPENKSATNTLGIKAPSSSTPSNSTLDAFFDAFIRVQNVAHIKITLDCPSSYHLNTDVEASSKLRHGVAVLTEMSKTLSTGKLPSMQTSYLSSLIQCYCGVFCLPLHGPGHFPALNPDLKWLSNEWEHVSFLKNLIFTRDLLHELTLDPSRQRQMAKEAYQMLGLERIDLVKNGSSEFIGVAEYFNGSFGSGHQTAKIERILRIERSGEAARFSKYRKANSSFTGIRRLLWHGSPCQNIIGILGQGFRGSVPSPHAPGGGHQGFFFADFAGKSVGYCRSNSGQKALMLLCEVELGKSHSPTLDPGYLPQRLWSGSRHISAFIPGNTSFTRWKDAKHIHQDFEGVLVPDMACSRQNVTASLRHNEYVVFDPTQIRQRYLVQIKLC